MVPKVAVGIEFAALTRQVFADGGCALCNPSAAGGSWAFVLAGGDGLRLCERSGAVTPDDLGEPLVSNNNTELLAVVLALEALPAGWCGDVYSDSMITIARIERPEETPFRGAPRWLVDRARAARRRAGEVWFHHVGGHPTRADLDRGEKLDGTQVHYLHARCDALCRGEAARLLVSR